MFPINHHFSDHQTSASLRYRRHASNVFGGGRDDSRRAAMRTRRRFDFNP